MATVITVFFVITMSLIIFAAIGWNVRSIMHYKKRSSESKGRR